MSEGLVTASRYAENGSAEFPLALSTFALGGAHFASWVRSLLVTQMYRLAFSDQCNYREPSALPALCRAENETSMTKRPGRVAFSGRLAQLVRAAGLQPAGRGFESLSAH